MSSNLTTLANLKAWLGNATPNDDVVLTRLIGQASRFILGYLERPSLSLNTYTERYDGSGGQRQMLRQWPVITVGTLTVGTLAVPAAASYGQSGYMLDTWNGYPPGGQQSVNLCGYIFSRGLGNVAVTYDAGYAVSDEAATVPGSAPYTISITPALGLWAQDDGVTLSDGAPLVKVAANVSPAAGQYNVTQGAIGEGKYTFNSADSGQGVLVSYSYVPADVEQLCIELVAERYRYKDRIGQSSKTLGGQETASYLITDMPPYLKTLAQPYRRVALA